MSLLEILGSYTHDNLILSQKNNKLSTIKKEERHNTRIIYYDCDRSIKEFSNLEKLGIDMDLFKINSYDDNKPKIQKLFYLEKFSKLKLLFLDNITTGYQNIFFESLFRNVPEGTETIILKKNDDMYDFSIVLNFLKNLPLSLKYIIFIHVTDTLPKKICYGDLLKIPFGCKIFHSINSSKTIPGRFSKNNNFTPILEYEENT